MANLDILEHEAFKVGPCERLRRKSGQRAARRRTMAKGQLRSNKEARKPKKQKPKTIAANPSQKSGPRGLENLKNS
jgi:hypothetical protein